MLFNYKRARMPRLSRNSIKTGPALNAAPEEREICCIAFWRICAPFALLARRNQSVHDWVVRLDLDGSLYDFRFDERDQALASAYSLKQEFSDRLRYVIIIAPEGQATEMFNRASVPRLENNRVPLQ